MFNIPFFQNSYDWITIGIGAALTAIFYYKYFYVCKSQQLLNSLPGIWTSLGLLFTFVAICSSMQELQNTPSLNSMEGEALKKVGATSIDITKIIRDIIPAFTTSIIGLVAGLMITIANKFVYFNEETKESAENDTPEEHIKGILDASNVMTERMMELKSIQEDNQKKMTEYNENLNNNVREQNRILQNFIDGFVNRMDDIFTQMNGAIENQIHEFGEEQFTKSTAVLEGILHKLTEQSNSLLSEQKNSVEKMVNATSAELGGISSNLSAKLQELATKYDELAEKLVAQSTEANEEIIYEIRGSFGTFIQELQSSLSSQCTQLSEAIANNVKALDGSYSFMKGHLAEIVANYEQSAEAFRDAVNVAHRTNERSENAIMSVTGALENMKTTNENIEKVISSVSTKQANMDKIVANIKEMNSTIEALQQLESVLNRISRK